MPVLRITDWPSKFPDPVRTGLDDKLPQDDILRSSQDELAQQGTNPLSQFKTLSIRWEFLGDLFYYFEGWFTHYLWRGSRGFKITIEGINYIAFMRNGYTAEAGDSFAIWTVSAELTVMVV